MEAIASAPGFSNSPASSAAYSIGGPAATPTFSPVSGFYTGIQTVTISDASVGASIYYTLTTGATGTTPTTSSSAYTGPIAVTATSVLEAIAAGGGYTAGSAGSASYSVTLPTAATPTLSPGSGSYGSTQSVTISDSTAGTSIYYTTDGSTPTYPVTGTTQLYTAPLNVSSAMTVQAIAEEYGYNNSSVGSAVYAVGGIAATPALSLGTGTFVGTQSITISDVSIGATIYYTLTAGTTGTTPSTNSTVYTGPVTISANSVLEAIASGSGFSTGLPVSASYTLLNLNYGSLSACNGMTLGSPAYQPYGSSYGALNNFVPFPSTNLWNTSIASAAVDPNSSSLMSTVGAATKIHPNFGQSPADGGIPYIVVDSTQTPAVPLNIIAYGGNSDVVVAPYPAGDAVPIEGDETDCSGWPDTYLGDAHSLVFDRATCWIYETYNTNRCTGSNGVSQISTDGEILWDAVNYNARPWGWTSADAAGLSIFAGLEKYSEAASGAIGHAIRFTMQDTLGDSNNGYFVLPASHGASSNTSSNWLPEGARLRLKSSFDISGFSPINQAILTGLQQYGMILADNGSNFYVGGDTDPNWDDDDLGNLKTVTAANFDVIQMTPEYDGMDSNSAPNHYPESLPTITSFSATSTSVAPGTPVTFNYSVNGTNYNANYTAETGLPYTYIDNIGPQRLSGPCPCSGSATITPTATQEYTFYALNTEGQAVSSSIIVQVTGSTLAPPVFTPAPGSYASSTALPVTLSTPSAAETSAGLTNATFYYTTNGSTPTTNSTKYTGTGTTGTAINIAASLTLQAIAVVPGYSGASTVSSGSYTIGSSSTAVDTPVLTPPPGTYNTIQTIYFQDATDDSTNGNTVYYTMTAGTTGTAPTAPSSGNAPTLPTLAFNDNGGCFACPPAAVIPVGTTTTFEAIAASVAGDLTNSAIATGTYYFQAGTPTFSPGGGSYSTTQTVTISSVTQSATIYYTTDGSTPSTNSAVYSGAVTVASSETVQALATYTGFSNSNIGSATYIIQASTPTFSPVAGSYGTPQTVTISDTTLSTTIYYTTDGSTPSTSSPVYYTPVTVSSNETLEALATAPGINNSTVATGVYSIGGPAATPTFSLAPGTYIGTQAVSISDASVGATIYYTLTAGSTGTTPTTSSTVYTGGTISVGVTSVLEAIATGGGYTSKYGRFGQLSPFLLRLHLP